MPVLFLEKNKILQMLQFFSKLKFQCKIIFVIRER